MYSFHFRLSDCKIGSKKITVKCDINSNAIKPFEIMITPYPTPKCTDCKTDTEIFGD